MTLSIRALMWNRVQATGVRSMTSMHSVTADTVADYKEKLSNPDWGRIDFKQFSKKYNSDLEKYDFSLGVLLKAFDKGE